MGSFAFTVGLGLGAQGMARATPEGPNSPIEVEISIAGPSECVTTEALDVAVRRRSARVQFSRTSEHTVGLDITPSRAHSGATVWRANVDLTRGAEREPMRTLEAPDCGSLAEAIGFIIALTFDPPSIVHPDGEPTSEARVSSSAQAPKAQQGPKLDVALVDQHAALASVPSPHAAVGVHVTTAFELVSAAGPLLLPGFGLGVQVGALPEPGLGPSFSGHLQVTGFPGRTAEERDGQAHFRLVTGRLTLCPLAFRAHAFTLRPCAFGTLGALQATGSATREPESHTRPWANVGGGLWAGVNVSAHFRIDLDAGVGATLIQDAFQFAPDVFYKTPVTSTRAGVGLSLLLP